MTNLKFKRFTELLEDFSLDLKLKKNSIWLEIGCGNGNLINFLNERAQKSYGIDVEFKKGPYLKKLIAKGLIGSIQFKGSSRLEIDEKNQKYFWPCESNSIDFSFSSSVLEHIFNLNEFAGENSRVLKPGAYCLHYFPSRTSIIEAHTGVPFGALILNNIYYRIFFLLGLSNKKFKRFSTMVDYMVNSTKYRSKVEIIRIFEKHNLTYIGERNDLIIKHMGPGILKFLSYSEPFCKLFGIFRSKILIFKKN